MNHTFSYNQTASEFNIATKVYSDFGSNIPLIRSFSLGSNWPIQHPLYPGEPIKYHFLFYLVVGLIEKVGIRIDFALNTLSALGLFLLLVGIFHYARKLFDSLSVGILSLIFFLFNGSFSFLDFFNRHPFNPDTLQQIVSSTAFSSFGPWDGSLISAFWNLNIFTNQRHLGFSLAICMFVVLLLFHKSGRPRLFSGFISGSLLLINQAGFIISLFFILNHVICTRLDKKFLFSTFLGLLPWVILYLSVIGVSPSIVFHFGYLLPESDNLFNFLKYWFLNFGLHSILIPTGFIMAPKQFKQIAIPAFLLFIIPNLFRLSPDIINNHKLFNFFLIVSYPFSAFTLTLLWRKNILGKLISVVLFPILILGGVFDFFPVLNDSYVRVRDVYSDKNVSYFVSATPPSSVILNDTWFYHPASLAGRSIFNGYPYFTWSYGYDQTSRERATLDIYASSNKQTACALLKNNSIDYVTTSAFPEKFIFINYALWQTEFVPDFKNSLDGFTAYSVNDNCKF